MTTPPHDSRISTNELYTSPQAPAALWLDLVRGRARVHDHFFDDAWMGLRLLSVRDSAAMNERSRSILSDTFAARAQKVVCIQRGLAPSTIASVLRQAVNQLGLECTPSRLPLLLVIAAQAGLDGGTVPDALFASQRLGDQQYTTLVLHDPLAWLQARLSAGEAAVARLRVHGASLEEIAALRNRSERTIANQLANAYRKLRVCGRSELLALLVFEYMNGNVPRPMPATAAAYPSGIYPSRANEVQNQLEQERAAAG